MTKRSTNVSERVFEALTAIPEAEWERADNEEEDAPRFVTGSPREVAVEVTDDEVVIYLWAAKWTSPYEIEDAPKIVGRINLETHGPEADEAGFASALEHLVLAARTLRRMKFVTCQFCDGEIPSEHQFDAQTCHGCASKEYGVVY